MGNSSRNTERDVMSTVATPNFDERGKARKLVKEIAGDCWDGRSVMIDSVYDAVTRHFPASGWTRRRLRAFFHREQAGVRWGEMRELEFVAEVARAERLRREQARAEHNEFLTHISNTLDRLEIADAAFHHEHRAALRAMALGATDYEGGSIAGQSDRNAAVGCARLGSDL